MNIDNISQFYGKNELERMNDSFNYYRASIEERSFQDEKKKQLLTKITELSIECHIMTKYTAFIIVDDNVNDTTLPTKKVIVPHHNDNMIQYDCTSEVEEGVLQCAPENSGN